MSMSSSDARDRVGDLWPTLSLQGQEMRMEGNNGAFMVWVRCLRLVTLLLAFAKMNGNHYVSLDKSNNLAITI